MKWIEEVQNECKWILKKVQEWQAKFYNKKCKKPHSLIIANLIAPKIDYQSYGKSRIDFRPFADVATKTTVLACMGGGRPSDGKPSKRAVLWEVLEKRKQKWEAMDAVSRLKHSIRCILCNP